MPRWPQAARWAQCTCIDIHFFSGRRKTSLSISIFGQILIVRRAIDKHRKSLTHSHAVYRPLCNPYWVRRGQREREREGVFIDSNSSVFQSCGRVPQPTPSLPSEQHPLPDHLSMKYALDARLGHAHHVPPLDTPTLAASPCIPTLATLTVWMWSVLFPCGIFPSSACIFPRKALLEEK